MSHNSALQYPNLANCQMAISSATASSRPPVKLPQECLDAANMNIPQPYDFSVEKSVMKKKELRDRDMIVSTASSREELEKSILVKMKSVTGAEEGVCVAMLEENGWELKTSIETFFQSTQ